jgi:hypothetical protein
MCQYKLAGPCLIFYPRYMALRPQGMRRQYFQQILCGSDAHCWWNVRQLSTWRIITATATLFQHSLCLCSKNKRCCRCFSLFGESNSNYTDHCSDGVQVRNRAFRSRVRVFRPELTVLNQWTEFCDAKHLVTGHICGNKLWWPFGNTWVYSAMVQSCINGRVSLPVGLGGVCGGNLFCCLAYCSTMKIETVRSSERSSYFYQATQGHIPEETTFRS